MSIKKQVKDKVSDCLNILDVFNFRIADGVVKELMLHSLYHICTHKYAFKGGVSTKLLPDLMCTEKKTVISIESQKIDDRRRIIRSQSSSSPSTCCKQNK